ncbi:Gfo/Idh/MocA family oxidoreductase [Cryomorpha ignava]|uniref:Gfo/Idh/MocA family oxidoreductase n=1 Tax=Cryomorpha ignava TaxID=101383 RepID=A0A7K3WQP5_9FLAO|nr:bi-domain-containing oxidoreductase [Cryomorpha ignava]NEN23341.1 Gfo/Idh/MocA family oxidoreductase [Cryomorpha ignava]
MEQLLQSLKAGDMEIVSLPNPIPGKGEVLVRTHFSAISTGTEGKTVSDARKGYIAKAKSRKEEVGKVVKAARSHGIADTYKMVMNKLEALQPLGYSLSGLVEAVGSNITHFKPGDRVACGGASASHAELVCVPENLCVRIPETANIDEAAFTTIGAIAMQGIRRAELNLGENCVVIGLGIIGQITLRLLKAAGVKAFGIDLKNELVDLAIQSGAENASLRSDELLEAEVAEFSHGHGVDAVIITAASASLDPVELAGILCRTHGKVVIVGSVPTGFSRKNYYRKELDLRMSTSYGPGRYDSNYEEKGLDYPIGQVRWTENRNMLAFAELLGNKSIDLSDLISHRFPFENAREAFDLVVNREADKMGILLEYDTQKSLEQKPQPKKENQTAGDRISLIGAGSFATNFLLPNLKDKLTLAGITTARPHTAENAARKFEFEKAYADADEMLANDNAAACVIATRHNSHAPLAIKALKNGKRVFLEKPLCLNIDEYFELKNLLLAPGTPDLMVGFNRRFAPQIIETKKKLGGIPLAINYRINAGAVPADHWVHDPEVGGGRIIGEVCHFIDLCCFLTDSKLQSVSATALEVLPQNHDTFTASLHFENGSVTSIAYFSNGNKALSKEYLEVFGGGLTAIVDDFKSMKIYGAKLESHKLSKQDKGHAAEVSAFAEAVKSGAPFPISVNDVLHATIATFALLESIQNKGEKINISEFESQWISRNVN